MRSTILLFVLTLAFRALAADPPMTIHEWGTFTNLQDESGRSVAGVNSEDEPLPAFCHDIGWRANVGDAESQRNSRTKQGYPQCHPDVTIRLETPVIYFHPAPGVTPPTPDVSVEFHGGLLTQYYPKAVSGTLEDHLTAKTVGKLDWHQLRLGLDKSLPETTSHVWTAPRNVDAATVTCLDNETEKFLFYRGVGHVDAPLCLVRTGSLLDIHGQLDSAFAKTTKLPIARLWFCEFHDQGQCAFREIKPLAVTSDDKTVLASTPADFTGEDFTTQHLSELTRSMRGALIDNGLFPDEADALLSTWELSYFESSGVRLFYLVPREWTEHYLPLKTSIDAPLTRVMVGRIDLVTPEHRRLLRQIAGDPDPKKNDAKLWKVYDQLGRFRNALVLDEQKRRSTTSLEAFIAAHDLQALAR